VLSCVPLVQPFTLFLSIVLFLLLDLLFLSFCSTYSTPLAQHVSLLLFNLSSCLTYSTPLAQHVVPLLLFNLLLLLFNLLFRSSCSTYSTSLVWPTTLLLLFNLLCFSYSTLLFYSSCFRLVLTLLFLFHRCGVWRSCPNLNFLGLTWNVRIVVFNFCLLTSF
jgi:hypothetical protein